jgi:CHAD domain-containing protein
VATLAVGVALARGRERRGRRGRAARPLRPHFALLPGEGLAPGARRIAIEQVDLAIAQLESGPGVPDATAVHETRKAIKRLRALLRLLRPRLRESVYRRENIALRQIAGRLAGARDAEVMLATLDALIARHPRRLRGRGIRRLRKKLRAERRRARRRVGDERTRALALTELRALRARLAAMEIDPDHGVRTFDPGLRRCYRQGRARRRKALKAGRRRRDAAMHDWRKRVKDLRYAAELMQRRDRELALNGSRPHKQPRRLARIAGQADDLGELLGEDHDLALLADRIRARSTRKLMSKRKRETVLELIDRRRAVLSRQAKPIAKTLYKRSPKRFAAGVRAELARLS